MYCTVQNYVQARRRWRALLGRCGAQPPVSQPSRRPSPANGGDFLFVRLAELRHVADAVVVIHALDSAEEVATQCVARGTGLRTLRRCAGTVGSGAACGPRARA